MKNNYTLILKKNPGEPGEHLISREVEAKTPEGAKKKAEKWLSDDNKFEILHVVQNTEGKPVYTVSDFLADHNINKSVWQAVGKPDPQ